MTKIININTGMVREIEKPESYECSICECPFIQEQEGGLNGQIGMLPVNFCPFCLSGVLDMTKQLLGINDEEDS